MKNPIRIVLVSDNHSLKKPIEDLQNLYHDYDYMFHCGDSELPKYMLSGFACVCGNNDYYGIYPQHLILSIGEHRFFLTHGHRDFIFGHYEMLAEKAKAQDCDVVCFGHTHIPYDNTIHGIRLLNPGSIWHNRDGSKPSYMLLELDGKDIHVQLMRWKSFL